MGPLEIIMLVLGSLFVYSLFVVLAHALVHNTTDCDSEDSWVVGAFWPVTIHFYLSWLLVRRVPTFISDWRGRRSERKKLKKAMENTARQNKYRVVDIPKGSIDSSEEYRRLGHVAEELRNKLTEYESSSGIRVGERV